MAPLPTWPRFGICSIALLVVTTTAPAQTHVTARVLGVDGKPVISEGIGALFIGHGMAHGWRVETDEEGNLKFQVPETHAGLHEGSLRLRRVDKDGRTRGGYRIEFAKLRAKPNLGAISLRELPLLVAGRVVNPAGRPIGDVMVSAQIDYGQAIRTFRFRGGGRFFAKAAKTDETGRFEIRGYPEGQSECNVTFGRKGFIVVTDRGRTKVGDKEVEVVMTKISKVHGRFVGLGGMAHFPGRVRLDPADQDPIVDGDSHLGLLKDGSFELSVPPGKYTLRVYLSREREPFHVVENIVVQPGQPCRDPRLGGLDLTKHVQIVTLTIRDQRKLPVERLMCGYHFPGHRYFYYSDKNGIVQIPLRAGGGRVSLFDLAGRYRVVRFDNLNRDQTVELQAAWLIQLRIKNLPVFPERIMLQATVNYHQDDVGRPAWGNQECGREFRIGADGRMTLAVMDPGKFWVILKAHIRRKDGRPGRELPGNFSFEIEVEFKKGVTEAKLEVELTAADLKKLAERKWR